MKASIKAFTTCMIENIFANTDHLVKYAKISMYTVANAMPTLYYLHDRKHFRKHRPPCEICENFYVYSNAIPTFAYHTRRNARLCVCYEPGFLVTCLSPDNPVLQNDLLQFIGTVVILDHPRLCKPLRTNILAIKVASITQ